MTGKFVLRTLAFLLLGSSLAAQGKVLKVYVGTEDNKTSKDVGDILRGKIGSTLRYALGELGPSAITIDVLCVEITTVNVACTAPTSYYPEKSHGLFGNLTTSIAIGNPYYVAQSLFDSFVEASSDPNLAAVEKIISASSSQDWFDGLTEGYQAGLKATCGDSKKPPAKPKSN
jgi:hypothetical protein